MVTLVSLPKYSSIGVMKIKGLSDLECEACGRPVACVSNWSYFQDMIQWNSALSMIVVTFISRQETAEVYIGI